jgi:hypothetical protein
MTGPSNLSGSIPLTGDEMIGWLSVAKAVLPHVADIVTAAAPVFTKRKSEDPAAAQPSLLQEQINELQAAAAQNNDYIKELASQLQTTISAFEEGALAADMKVRRAYTLCYIALAISIVSAGVSLFAVFRL